MSAVFVQADQPEILRAAQKDESYVSTLRNDLADIIQRLFGNQTWLKVQWLSDLSCLFLYYSLTTLADSQTLGEEYVGLIQVDPSLRSLPSKLTRLTAITLQVLGPRLFARVTKWADAWLRDPQHCPDLRPEVREHVLRLTDLMQTSSFWIGRLNLVLFYMYGKYYRLSQRMTGIHFIFTSSYSGAISNYKSTFRLIGKMVLTHLILLLGTNLVLMYRNGALMPANSCSMNSDENVKSSAGGAKCSLCWDERKDSACTPCGHLFCWQCILQWLQTKHECPLCRESVQPSRIVPLLNYE